MELTKHFTTRTDGNHATPVKKINKVDLLLNIFIQKLVRFCVYYRIKLRVPPLLENSANSFKFRSCERTSQVKYLTL